MHLGVIVLHIWCPELDWHSICGVFPVHYQCSQDRVRMDHCDTDQDKVLRFVRCLQWRFSICPNCLLFL